MIGIASGKQQGKNTRTTAWSQADQFLQHKNDSMCTLNMITWYMTLHYVWATDEKLTWTGFRAFGSCPKLRPVLCVLWLADAHAHQWAMATCHSCLTARFVNSSLISCSFLSRIDLLVYRMVTVYQRSISLDQCDGVASAMGHCGFKYRVRASKGFPWGFRQQLLDLGSEGPGWIV